MRKGFGVICLLLGIGCLVSAIGLVLYNRWEADNAQVVSQAILADVESILEEPPTLPFLPDVPEPSVTETVPAEMATVKVDGYDCIGILSIPVLELELPVLTDWNYEKLKKAPCHYYGSCYESDFVIAAHNYAAHFGRLSELQPGDLVLFTDATGQLHGYEVVLLETLLPTATEEMITSGFDLSLYTCTPGGSNRVTVRCRAVKE